MNNEEFFTDEGEMNIEKPESKKELVILNHKKTIIIASAVAAGTVLAVTLFLKYKK